MFRPTSRNCSSRRLRLQGMAYATVQKKGPSWGRCSKSSLFPCTIVRVRTHSRAQARTPCTHTPAPARAHAGSGSNGPGWQSHANKTRRQTLLYRFSFSSRHGCSFRAIWVWRDKRQEQAILHTLHLPPQSSAHALQAGQVGGGHDNSGPC